MHRFTHNATLVHASFLIVVALFCISQTAYSQENEEIKINEYYWDAPLAKVLSDFKNKYKIPLEYEEATVKDLKFGYLFTNTPASRAMEIVFRENKTVGFILDSNHVYKVLPLSIINASKLSSSIQKWEGKPEKFKFTATGVIKDKLSG